MHIFVTWARKAYFLLFFIFEKHRERERERAAQGVVAARGWGHHPEGGQVWFTAGTFEPCLKEWDLHLPSHSEVGP